MNNKFQNITNYCLKNIIFLISLIIMIIGILSIFITAYFDMSLSSPNEITHFKYSIGVLEVFISIIVIALIIFIVKKILKKIPSKFIFALLSILSFALFIFWVNILHLKPETDQKMIHDMSIYLLGGSVEFFLIPSQYLFYYPYQFGLTFFVSIIYKFFGQDYMIIQYLNCIASIINMFIIFKISKILFKNENIQKILTILLSIFSIYWMFFNPHFYGNIIGLTFSLSSILFILFYFENKNLFNLFLSGILIAISILLKSNYNIFLCGIILILILDVIKKWKLKNLLIIPIFIIGYFSINLGYNSILNYMNLKLPQGVPMISFAYMGFSEPIDMAPGWYNENTLVIYNEAHYDNELARKITYEKIGERLSEFLNNPKMFFDYFSQKIASTWLNPTFQTIYYSHPGIRYIFDIDYIEYLNYHKKVLSMLSDNLYKIEEFIFKIYQIIIFVFAGFGLLKLSKNINLKQAILPTIFLGGFIFHIIWETKAIYVIQYYFLLLPFAAYGLNYLIEFLLPNWKLFFKNKLKKKNNTNK